VSGKAIEAADIDVSKLSDEQLDGRACVRCGKSDLQPMVPIVLIVGCQTFIHMGADCLAAKD
jgi:hypothetical protein